MSKPITSVPLSSICRQDRSAVPADSEEAAHLRYVGMEHVESGTGRVSLHAPAAQPIIGQCFRFDSRHVLYGKLRPYLNKVAVPDFEGRCSTELIPLLPVEGVDRTFLAYTLRHPAMVDAAMGEKTGSRMPRADMAGLMRQKVSLPPLARQREIVARLDAQLAAAARARTTVAAQLADAEKLARVIVDQEFSAHRWKLVPVRELSSISGGIQKTPDRAPQSFHRPFLTVRNVQRGALDLSAVERFELTAKELERYRLEAGDLLIVEGNGSREHIGRNAIFPTGMAEEWIHQNHIIRVRFDGTKVDPRFASIYFNSQPGREQMIERAATTTGLFTLSTSKVGSLELPIVPLAEQRRIVARLETALAHANSLTTSATARLADLDRLPAALLRAAFAG